MIQPCLRGDHRVPSIWDKAKKPLSKTGIINKEKRK